MISVLFFDDVNEELYFLVELVKRALLFDFLDDFFGYFVFKLALY